MTFIISFAISAYHH